MSQFGETQLNAGSGGSLLATSTFVNPLDSKNVVMPWSAITYLASGNPQDTTGVFQVVDAAHGLPVSILGNVTIAGTVSVSAASLPLPTGASTDATLASMSAKLPAALGQHAMAASMSVAIASDQGAVPVSGTLTIGAGTNVIGHVIVDSGTITIGNASLPVTQSGAWSVGQAGAPWSMAGNVASGTTDAGNPVKIGGVFNSAAPTLATGQRGDAQLDANGNLKTVIQNTVAVSGTFWQTTQPVSGTVTANIGTANGLALDATVAALQVAQGSATSGEKGSLIQGAVTTAAPAYTTGNTNPLSLTTAGALRVDGSGVTQPISGSITVSGTPTIAGTVTSNQGTAAALTSAWPVKVTDGTNVQPTGDSSARSIHTTLDNTSIAVTGTFWQATQPVSLASLPALPSGTNNTGYVTPAAAGATTGATPFHLVSAATTNATSLKASAGTLWEMIAMNLSASIPAYLKLFDKASAPTLGTDTPVYVVPLPTAGSASGAGSSKAWPVGLKFTNGIAYAITGGIADNDATAVAASQVVLSGSYS